MTDIADRKDIESIVHSFYQLIRSDSRINYIFDDIAKINWGHHTPIICDFWESVLFGAANYKGNAMLPHISLNHKIPLTGEHFEVWLQTWKTNIDQLFCGEIADLAKERADNIAIHMQHKIKATF